MSIKLLIADDHEVVRSGLKSLLTGTDIKIVAEAATGEQAVRLALKHEPDVVLLDIRMPEGDGLNALGRIKLDRPNMPILMLSTYDNPTYVARAVALGASGFLLKGISRDKLIEAIHAAHDNDLRVVALTGKGGGDIGRMLRDSDVHLCVPSDRTARIQEIHLLTIHCLCDGIDCLLLGVEE